MLDLLVRPNGGTGWAVVDRAGQTLARGISQSDAATRAVAIERKARLAAQRLRPCLCCTVTFASDGAHNRMCDDCRGHG